MRQSVVSVMSKTFATMFFLDIEPQEMGKVPGSRVALPPNSPEVESPSGGFIRSRIRFEGPRSGMISLVLPAALAKLMAKNFLGLEEGEASKSQTGDMAGELANIISGNLLPALDKKGSYSLSLPKTEPGDDPGVDPPDRRSGFALDFDAEGHWVQFSICFDE
jgi:Chemotaxis phosphatase CheX